MPLAAYRQKESCERGRISLANTYEALDVWVMMIMIFQIKVKMKHKAIEAVKGRKTTTVLEKMSFKLSNEGSLKKRAKSFRTNARTGPNVREDLIAHTGIQSRKKSTLRTITNT